MPSDSASSTPHWRATQGRILQIAWPVMLSNITVPLLGLVDAAILGHLPDVHHLGAVAIGAQLFTLLCWSFSFLRMGTTAASARTATPDDALDALKQSLWLALLLVVPVLMLALTLLIPVLLPMMGATTLVEQGAQQYLAIRVWSVPATFAQYVILGWFIGQGKTRVPLILMTVTNLVNAALDYLLVYHFDMTSDGVALGSVCADYTSLALGIWFIRREGLTRLGHLPSWQRLSPLVEVNSDLFVRTTLLLGVLAFFHAQGAQQGDLILAANSLLLLIANALDGFAHAAESLIGRALASHQFGAINQLIGLTGLNSLLMALLLTLGFVSLDGQLWLWLSDNPDLLPVMADYQWYLFALPLVGVGSFWVDGLCIGSGATRLMRNVMILSIALVFVPLWWFGQAMGNHGLWMAFLAMLIARFVFAISIVYGLIRHPVRYTPDA
ncbi:MAG: MATE family efflux transporter [Oceanospirillaceae bacterium]|nr:MATE family efflux transporter [Oceanospirillaceae bacterium]|tara:strand:- start:3809 stop:5131 length:1323 start_codon:yes stop_codon:yes gene_type:complete